MKSEFVPIKMHTVNHFLCKSFLLCHPIHLVSPVDIVNVNVKFIPLRSHVHKIKFLFCPLRVLKAPTIYIVNTVIPPDVCNVVSRINPTHCICKAPQYTHIAVVKNPKNTTYLGHKSISGFLQPGIMFICNFIRFWLINRIF